MEPPAHHGTITSEEFKRLGHQFITSTLHELDYDALVALGKDLERQNAWPYLIGLCEYLIKRDAMPVELHPSYLMALRATNNSLEALKFSESHATPSLDAALCLQIASLHSELGAYELIIADRGKRPDQHKDRESVDLLVLQAWAYENCAGRGDASEAYSLYKEIISRLNTQTPEETADYLPPHPEARTGKHDFTLIRLLWAQRGCGNAVRALARETEPAVNYWANVVSAVDSLDVESQNDPYVQRILAWCHFRLGDYDLALKGYRRTLDSGVAKYRPQLEQAFVLFVIGRVIASLDQLEKAVYDLKDIDPVKRCGFLRSALAQFLCIVSERGLDTHPDAREIVTILYRELDIALEALSHGIPEHVLQIRRHLQLFIDTLPGGLARHDRTTTQSIQIIKWASVKVVGLEDPLELPCGVFAPVVEYEGRRYACVADLDDSGELSSPARLGAEPANVKRFPPTEFPGPTYRILYLSEPAKEILASFSIPPPLLSIGTWFATEGDDEGSVTCVENKVAIQALDHFAVELLTKAFCMMAGMSRASRPHWADTSALLAFCAATRLETIYQAALIYFNLAAVPVDVRLLRRGRWPTGLPEPEELSWRAKAFGVLVEKVSYSDAMNLDSNTLSSLAEDIILRGERTSAIKDTQTRAQEAVWAACEAQLLVGSSGLPIAALQEKLATAISRATMWYLPRNVDTLMLAQEPAFYCAVQGAKLSRPILDVFSYFRAPSIADWKKFEEGPIAARAKRSTR